MDIVLRALVAFAAMFVMDYWYAKYTLAITARRHVASSLYAGGMQLLSSAVVLSYVHDWRMIAPVVLGAFAGTYFASVWSK